jgi:hypothetical protein
MLNGVSCLRRFRTFNVVQLTKLHIIMKKASNLLAYCHPPDEHHTSLLAPIHQAVPDRLLKGNQ